MSGGDLTMDYNQEHTYFKGNCIEYDVIDMFQMLVDVALEPKSVLAANVARAKNRKTHDLHHHLAKFDPFKDHNDLLFRTAYGYNTLGMPLLGLESNIDNLDARVLQKFIMDTVTPKKCVIVGSGVRNHQEFVDLVKERIGELLPVPEHMYDRKQANYIGGEYRTWTETPSTRITLGFEGATWSSTDAVALDVAHAIIGESAIKGAGQLSRASTLLHEHRYVDYASSINTHFQDSGIFGVTVEGPGSHSKDLLNVAMETLSELRSGIDGKALDRAQNQLILDVARAYDN
jgi:predicted Zn-dependent peptidase